MYTRGQEEKMFNLYTERGSLKPINPGCWDPTLMNVKQGSASGAATAKAYIYSKHVLSPQVSLGMSPFTK